MKYIMEWQMSGETEIDFTGTSWLPEEVDVNAAQGISDASKAFEAKLHESFADCVANTEGEAEYRLRRVE